MAGRKSKPTEQVQIRLVRNEYTVAKVRGLAKNLSDAEIQKQSGEIYFKVLVWYKFVAHGEIEKDFDIYYTYALSKEHAKLNITNEYFSGRSKIPFNYEINEENLK